MSEERYTPSPNPEIAVRRLKSRPAHAQYFLLEGICAGVVILRPLRFGRPTGDVAASDFLNIPLNPLVTGSDQDFTYRMLGLQASAKAFQLLNTSRPEARQNFFQPPKQPTLDKQRKEALKSNGKRPELTEHNPELSRLARELAFYWREDSL